ncbi:MAG: putative Ig domain-containing protein, partial [Magnetococcales bacterium]|nr:putative Ig domain-containing protein [Magnetococcales bacterium]
MSITNLTHGISIPSGLSASIVDNIHYPLDGEVLLEQSSLFLEGEFARDGDNLVITGPTGEMVTVAKYFNADPPPILTAPNGAFLLPETVALLLPVESSGVLVAGPVPEQAGSDPGAAKAGGSIGKVKAVNGSATARSQGGESRVLKSGDEVFEGEELKTAEGGQLQLQFADGTQFQLGTGARIVLNKYLYNASAGQGEFAATVMKGAFAYSSGNMAHQHAGRHTTIKTPTATIGVRGSALQGEVAEDGQTTVVHTAGILDISDAHGQGTVTLLQPGMATVVTLDGSPQPAFPAPKSFLDRFNSLLPPLVSDHKQDSSSERSDAGHETSFSHDLMSSYQDVASVATQIKGTLGINLDKMSQAEVRELAHDLRELASQLPPVVKPTLSTSHGVFLDSAVAGIEYRTASLSGITDKNGGFSFKEGETVTFYIGDIKIGSADLRQTSSGLPIVTPTLLAETATRSLSGDSQTSKKNDVIVNVARLLQSLDSDGDPSNGITISEEIRSQAVGSTAKAIDVTASKESFGENSSSNPVLQLIKEAKGEEATLVSEESALQHYEQTLSILDSLKNVTVETASFLFAVQGQFFAIDLGELFTVPAGSTLDYKITLTSGAEFDEWLHFDAGRVAFSGTPGDADVGSTVIKITATMQGSGAVSGSVNYVLMVGNINDAPEAAVIADRVSDVGGALSNLTIAPFSDADGDSLHYTATLANDSALPAWLHFDESTRTFSSASLMQAGQYALRVTATDPYLASAYKDFVFTVDTAPTGGLPEGLKARAAEDNPFTFELPVSGFSDIDAWDTLSYSYSARHSNGSIPAWLLFNASTHTFTGTPGSTDGGTVLVTVTATDRSGRSVSDSFQLEVAEVNHAPTTTGIAAHTARLNQALNLTVAPFTDVDMPEGDKLTYQASLADNTALPTWLQFDSATRTFTSGNLTTAGQHALRVTATDSSGASVSSTFTLTVDTPPTLPGAIADQNGGEKQAFSFTVSAFVDEDAWDSLTYSSAAVDAHGHVPAWLQFDPATRVLSGTPGAADVGVVTVTVTATDKSGLSVADSFLLTVANLVNDAPYLNSPIVDQRTTVGSLFYLALSEGTFADLDPNDTLELTAKLESGADLPGWLHFDSSTHAFYGIPGSADQASLAIRVTAQDAAQASASDTFILEVTPVSLAPQLLAALPDQMAHEDSAFTCQIASDAFRSATVGGTLQYSAKLLDGSALPSWLQFDSTTRTFSGTADNAAVGTLNIKVTASDAQNGTSVSDVFALAVANSNDVPTVVQHLTSQVAASGTAFVLPTAGTFQDVDAHDTLTYRATLQDGSALPSWLRFETQDLSFHGTPTAADVGYLLGVRLTATDSGNAHVADDFLILVTAPNTAPTLQQNIADKAATEDTLFLFEVPSATFVDVDANDSLTLSARLASGAVLPSWLVFDADTRTFVGTPGNAQVGELQLQVTATDWAGAKAVSNPFKITIANSNDAPTVATAVVDHTVFSGTAFTIALPTQTFADQDVGDSLTLTASQADGSALPTWLRFDATSGTFSGQSSTLGTVNIKVTATDTAQAKVSDIFSLTVRSQNTAPTVDASKVPADRTIEQGQSLLQTLDSGLFQDVDTGDRLTWSAALSNGNALPSWLQFDGATKTFLGTPGNADVGVLSVTVKATDRDGAVASDTFQLTVSNRNDAPVLTPGKEIADQKVTLGSAFHYTLDSALFSDPDIGVVAGSTLTLSAKLLDGSATGVELTPTSNFWLRFDPTTGTFSGTPTANDQKSISIKVIATDNGTPVLSAADIFNLTINTAPTTTGITSPGSIKQGDSFFFKIPTGTFLDSDAGDTLTLSATNASGGPLPSWLTFNPDTRTFVGTPENGDVGTVAVKVWATDSAGDYTSASFALVVENVNDAPVLDHKLSERTVDIGQAFQLSLGKPFSDPDKNDSLSFAVTLLHGSGSNLSLSTDTATGNLLLNGTAITTPGDLLVKITATDTSGLKVSDVFAVHALAPNHAPIVQTIAAQSATQGKAFVFQLPATTIADSDGDQLTVTAKQADGSALPSWLLFDVDTGTFSGKPDNSAVGSLSLRVTATDARGGSDSKVFALSVADVNDAPTLNIAAPIAAQTATQGSSFRFVVPGNRFVDIDSGDSLTFTAAISGTTATMPTWLTFDPGSRLFSGTPDAVGSVTIRLTATDTGGLSVSDSFTINVLPPNHAPTVAQVQGNQSVMEEMSFSYQVPIGTFHDVDQGDNLKYSAELLSGAELPSWLHFDTATRTFFGTPANQLVNGVVQDDVGSLKIKVTATDARGSTASDVFNLTVSNVNDAPVVIHPAASQVQSRDLTAARGSVYKLQLSEDTFIDPDKGDSLTWSATLLDGTALTLDSSHWLHFDANTRTFFGTPATTDQTAQVKLIATDASGAKGYDLFTITVENANQAPVVNLAPSSQTVAQGDAFYYQFSQQSFTDADGDALTYQMAGLANNSTLPTWLHFDAETRTFSGRPGNADVGTLGVKLIATDEEGASTAATFNITVTNVNDAPTVAIPLANQSAVQGVALNYRLPTGSFVDVDAGDSLTMTATDLNGQVLPSWLHFDAATQTFSGTPQAGDVGSVMVKVTATDSHQASVSDSFMIEVSEHQTGVFLDSKVIGLTYTSTSANGTVSYTGLTDANGGFRFNAGDSVSFSLGGISFGKTTAGSVITPATLAGSSNVATITNMLRLLQTLDTDDNPENGITISQAVRDAAAGKSLDFTLSADNFANSTAVKSYLTAAGEAGGLVSTESAWRHFLGTLATVGSGDTGIFTTSKAAAIPVAVEDSAFSYKLSSSVVTGLSNIKSWSISTASSSKQLPKWLSFDKDSGLISGTPTNNDVGTVDVIVTAADSKGNKSSEMVTLTILNSNDAPTYKESSFNETKLTKGKDFFFQIPSGTFKDVDVGDQLTLSATRGDGTALPTWLSFDRETGVFSGTPTSDEDLVVKITATDKSMASVSALFAIEIEDQNTAPKRNVSTADQTATEDTPFRLQLAANAFKDDDASDSLRYSVTQLGNGNERELPKWLSFDPDTRTFSGTPGQADVDTLIIKVSVTDQGGKSASDMFKLFVNNAPDAPTLTVPLVNREVAQESTFRFSVPSNTFSDVDPKDSLTLTATQSDGSVLPSWIKFDAQTGTFTGTGNTPGVLHLRVTATDTTQLVTSALFDLTVKAVNHAPTLNPSVNLGSPTVAEGGTLSYQLPVGHFFDADNDSLSFTATPLSGGSLPSWLSFNTANNTFTATPGSGTAGTVGIKVTARDAGGLEVVDSFTLTVTQVNHAPVRNIDLLDHAATVSKSFSVQIPSSAFVDVDAGDRLTYSAKLANGNDLPNWLRFDGDTRSLTGTPTTAGTVNVLVTATDKGGMTATDTFAINVADINHAPTRSSTIAVASLGTQSATEGTPFSFSLPANLFADQDSGDSLALSFANVLTGTALPTWLTFNSATGQFTGTPTATDVGLFGVRVIATDRGGLTVSDSFSIDVHALNRNPVMNTSIADQTIATGNAFSFKLAQGTFTDPNAGDLLTISAKLEGGAALSTIGLSFDPASKTFTGTPTAGLHNIVVTATDNGSPTLSVSDSFLLNVNSAPTVANPIANQSVNQNSAFNFQIPLTTFSDADVTAGREQLSLTVSSASDSALPTWLQFNAASRTLSSSRALTNDDVGNYSIKVQATDSAGEKAFATFNLAVANVNDVPVLAGSIANVPVVSIGKSLLFTVPENIFSDPDGKYGDRLTLSATQADGTALPSWLHFDAASRSFSGISNTVTSLSVKVIATDQANATISSNAFTVSVANLNHAPVINRSLSTAPLQASQGQGFSFQFASDTFTDQDAGESLTLAYTAERLTGGALPTWLNFNVATRTFTGTPGNADVGSLDVKLVATDVIGAKVSDTFRIAIANVNDAPTGEVAISGTAAQNSQLTVANTLADLDGMGTVSYHWESSSNGTTGWTSLAGSTSLPLTQAEVGRFIRVVASYTDGQGTAESVASAVTTAIANINDRPSGSVNVSGALQVGSLLTTSHTLADVDGLGTVNYQWQTSVDGLANWSPISNATLPSLTLSQNEAGKFIRVLASYTDGQGTAESVASSASRLNAAPTITSPATANVVENSTSALTVVGADQDAGDTLTYNLTSGVDASRFVINARTGVLSFLSAPDFEAPADVGADNVYNLTVQVSDGLLTASQTIAVTVVNLNELPVVTSAVTGSITENAAVSAVVYTATATDPDAGESRTYALSGTDADSFNINSSTGSITLKAAADFENKSSYSINIVATDAGGLSTTQAVTIRVLDTNEAPSTPTTLHLTMNEDTAHVFQSSDFGFYDVDAGNTLSVVRITSLPTAGTLTLNGQQVAQNQEIAANEIGHLQFTPTANANGVDYATIGFQVSDGIDWSTSSSTINIEVAAVNDAPLTIGQNEGVFNGHRYRVVG